MNAADLVEALANYRDFEYETLSSREVVDEVVVKVDGVVYRVKVTIEE